MNQTIAPDVRAGRLKVPAMSRRNRNGPIRYRSQQTARAFAKTGQLVVGRQLKADTEGEGKECQRCRVEFLNGWHEAGEYQNSSQPQTPSSPKVARFTRSEASHQRDGENHCGDADCVRRRTTNRRTRQVREPPPA